MTKVEGPFAEVLSAVMSVADEAFNGRRPPDAKPDWREVGIVILTFAYGDKTSGVANYISNGADRTDMIRFLRETADRFERNELLGAVQSPLDPAPQAAAPRPTMNVLRSDSEEVRQLAKEGRMVDSAWQEFREFVIPDDAEPHQLYDLKATFFAGAHTMFEALSALGEVDEAVDAEMVGAMMNGINTELIDFAEMMAAVAQSKLQEGPLN